MYDSFYNLAEKPFQIDTDPKFLWRGEKHREALANLQYGLLNQNGFVVLTGDVGTGKTTLVNALLATLDDSVFIAKINHPSLQVVEFFNLVAKSFDSSVSSTSKSDLLLFFNSFLHQANEQGKTVLLIIDEAHRLSIELLEEIRLLSNIEANGRRLLNIIFVGQDELKPILSLPQCRALRQRITLFYEIQALSSEETLEYVAHRLKVSGLQGSLFTGAALHKIHAYSKGNPRMINILCDRALLTGYVRERKEIDADIIEECSRELILDNGAGNSTQTRPAAAAIRMLGSFTAQARKAFRVSPASDDIGTAQSISRRLTRIVRFLKKYRFRIVTFAMAAGIAFTFLSLTIGAYKTAWLRKEPEIVRPQSKAEIKAQPGHQETGKPPSPRQDAKLDLPPDNSTGEQISASLPQLPPLAASSAEPEPAPLELAAKAIKQKNYHQALELLEAYQSAHFGQNSKSRDELYSRALVGRAAELETSSPLQAETMLRKAIDVNPMAADAYMLLGRHYARRKDYERAVDFYQEAVRLDPNSADGFFNLGFAWAATGKYEASATAFARVVQLKPPYLVKSLFNLAVVQHKLGKKMESIANLEAAAAMEPENQKVQSYLKNLKESATARVAGQSE